MIKVCLCGLGRAGIEIARFLVEQPGIVIVSAISSPYSTKIGKDLGELIGGKPLGIKVSSSERIEEVVLETKPDVAVDFTKPDAALRNGSIFSEMKVNLVIGTTGFADKHLEQLYEMANKYDNGIVYAPNITLGVNTLMLLTNIASQILSGYDFQITEIHHNQKKDIPSGTAIKISEEILKGLNQVQITDKSVPINSVRAGGIVGKHEVLIASNEDQITISHESFSRRAFAIGALKAISFIYRKSGFFEMKDVLDLKKILQAYVEEQEEYCS